MTSQTPDRDKISVEAQQPMSALKKMPAEKKMRVLRYSAWFFLIAVVGALAYLRFFIEPDHLHSRYTLKTLLIIGIILAFVINYYFANRQKCPDCRHSLREVNGAHPNPQAGDTQLLYCKGCDTIWDTAIPKSND